MIGRVGMESGGQAGARLLPAVGARASADTVLRVVRRMHAPVLPTPRVLGVDEWAWRKGHVYGTILVDLERRVAVDVLPERSAESLANWLVQHPGVEIITRDRSEIYAEGARRGAPEAVQVADRWHLLKNMGDLVERVLQRHRKELHQTAAESITLAKTAADREDDSFVQALTARCETIRTAQAQAVEFGRLVRAHDIAALESWLSTAAGSALPELRDFAAGMLRDEAAVRAAVELPWSNGQTEGQVNRLKMLKRQMYGRASIGLLRQRVLHVA